MVAVNRIIHTIGLSDIYTFVQPGNERAEAIESLCHKLLMKRLDQI